MNWFGLIEGQPAVVVIVIVALGVVAYLGRLYITRRVQVVHKCPPEGERPEQMKCKWSDVQIDHIHAAAQDYWGHADAVKEVARWNSNEGKALIETMGGVRGDIQEYMRLGSIRDAALMQLLESIDRRVGK